MFLGHCIGYGSLENLLTEALRKNASVYADLITISESARMGISNRRTFIQAAFLDEETDHFWRWPIASVAVTPNDEPLDPDRADRASSAIDTAWPLVFEHIKARGVHVVQASISMPSSLGHLDGHRPEFLEFIREKSIYSLEVSHGG